MLEQVGVGGHEDGGGPASRDNSFYHQLHLHHHHQQQQQQQQQQTLSEASLRMVLEETVHIDEAAGDTVRILSFCDVGCIVAVTSRSDDTTDLFYWRGDEYLRRLISVNHWRVTSASMNTRQTLLAFGLADELRQDHFFKLISLGTHMEEFDVDECKWTTSQHAYVNLHFMEASHGCDSLVVTHLTNSLCANTDPTRSSSNASDSSSNLWVYNIFSDLDELGEPIIDFEKLASPWEYDRNVLWYQFDRPTNMFYCIECCDPETHLLRSGGSSGVGDDDDDEGGGDGRNGDDEMFPTNDGTLPAGESPEVEFHFSAVHCTYGQLQRTVSLRLPDCISSHLQVAISGPFSHTPACDASLFEHAAIQVVDLGHGALCLAVQDHHRYAVYCAHWQCVLSSGFDVDPASQQLSRMIFLGLNDYVLAVLPGCAVHYWNCGSKHEPLEPFALPCDPLLDAQLHNAYSIRMKKSTTQALIVTSDLEFPIPVALSRKAICSLLLKALMWHLRDEPKDAALETQKKQYLYALQVRTNHIVNACEALEKQCSPTCHPAIFNLLEKTLFVLKQLQFPVPERLHATLARLGFDVLPRPLFVQYLDTGIFQIDKVPLNVHASLWKRFLKQITGTVSLYHNK
ncbi:hypothetical protein PTSG_09950 [Salpingoeca rosetta]|uniref:Gamma-secretase-activating protein C-terminal domain-containing protein n=1 Tax=Salpingoeca rosetta (strain ATCC 50818 / BSB-021) TaxID=946362 RepID=F2UNM4_SALR5|nr:uncharacterized protein PTSG_09950 [Salpingoeca rosetta]EGD79229.1 hypothetical protein PTSG_09950 [Salpingoeca rosetta]|eukprot:XP_004989314.1 hypothetical protein PTSG_09950 [Salpingoeca rosetta]